LDYSDVEDDGDMATFSGRISQDWFYHVKWKLEAILKSSANADVRRDDGKGLPT